MEDLIYARQSVDKEDSISIESQIELCLREVSMYDGGQVNDGVDLDRKSTRLNSSHT